MTGASMCPMLSIAGAHRTNRFAEGRSFSFLLGKHPEGSIIYRWLFEDDVTALSNSLR